MTTKARAQFSVTYAEVIFVPFLFRVNFNCFEGEISVKLRNAAPKRDG